MTSENLTKFYVYCSLKARFPKRKIISIDIWKTKIDKVFSRKIKFFIFSITMEGSEKDNFDRVIFFEEYIEILNIEELLNKLSELYKHYSSLNCNLKKEVEEYRKIESEIKFLLEKKENFLSDVDKELLEISEALQIFEQ